MLSCAHYAKATIASRSRFPSIYPMKVDKIFRCIVSSYTLEVWPSRKPCGSQEPCVQNFWVTKGPEEAN
uniref:Uncharacterized protein n=1 Tax=Anguilla anguilla TaxID=7936 RepID=A0A0E9RMU1_ANGAN